MPRFPFVVNRRKAVVIEAPTVTNAIDRITSKYQDVWIKTKFAKNVSKHLNKMDLVSAQQKVKADSKAKKKILHYIVLVDDEFEVKTDVDIDKDDIYSTWRGGVKIDAPEGKVEPEETKSTKQAAKSAKQAEVSEAEQSENKNTMKTKARKPVKKAAVKKVAKKSNGEKVRALDAPIKGGATLLILQALKKKICTKQELAKVGKTKETNINWYLNKIKNNGHAVELTDKGYKLK